MKKEDTIKFTPAIWGCSKQTKGCASRWEERNHSRNSILIAAKQIGLETMSQQMQESVGRGHSAVGGSHDDHRHSDLEIVEGVDAKIHQLERRIESSLDLKIGRMEALLKEALGLQSERPHSNSQTPITAFGQPLAA